MREAQQCEEWQVLKSHNSRFLRISRRACYVVYKNKRTTKEINKSPV